MKMLLKEARIKPIIFSFLRRSRLISKLLPLTTGGSDNSRYCYSVWLRHLVQLNEQGSGFVPENVAELGPGDSLGVGIAALLSGARQYIALDVTQFWNPQRNVKILNELIQLFKTREPIPDTKEFPLITPTLKDYSFPSEILTEELLNKTLNPTRIEILSKEISSPELNSNSMVRCAIPWYEQNIISHNSVDLIISQAVLEHVDDLENTYAAMNIWLKKDGVMSHSIDFKSHGFTRHWNGHWTLSAREWKILRGGRIYAINRAPLSEHRRLLRSNGFEVLHQEILSLPNSFKKNVFHKDFRHFNDKDFSVSELFVIAKKINVSPTSKNINN